jgi:hypothetical protein
MYPVAMLDIATATLLMIQRVALQHQKEETTRGPKAHGLERMRYGAAARE